MSFGGNPNVTITAINTSGGIASSRTSGQTPCFVHVSASAITATGTSVPYEDLEYTWDFGDPSGTETFRQPINLAGNKYIATTVNANTAQTGPEAAYVYRSSGTFTVTLTIRGQNGAGFTETNVTQNISVTDYSASGGDWYFDSAAAGGGDGSIGLPFNDLTTMNTKMATANTRINIKRGSVWTGAIALNVTAAPMRLGVYSTGADPILNANSGTSGGLFINDRDGPVKSKDDIVVSYISFVGSGSLDLSGTTANLIQIASVYDPDNLATLSNVYLDNVSCTTSTTVMGDCNMMQYNDPGPSGQSTKAGIWGGRYTNSLDPAQGTGVSIFEVGQTWGFVVGCFIEGAGTNVGLHHHIYPGIQTHALFRYITFGSGPTRNYNINTNFNSLSGSPEVAQYYCISDNDTTGTTRAYDASNGTNDPTLSTFQNFVIQRNAIHGFSGVGTILFFCATSMTVRDNLAWNNTNAPWFWPGESVKDLLIARLYRNKIYKDSTGFSGAGQGVFSYLRTSVTFTLAQTITDNIIEDLRTAANVVELTVSAQQTAVATINRNQYYAPNDANSQFIYDVTTPIAFTTWQSDGFDSNGFVARPDWTNPSAGDFSPVAAVQTSMGGYDTGKITTRPVRIPHC